MSPLLSRPREEMLERIAPDLIRPLQTVKRETIERAMVLCQGNVKQAARKLGISYGGLRKMLSDFRKADD